MPIIPTANVEGETSLSNNLKDNFGGGEKGGSSN